MTTPDLTTLRAALSTTLAQQLWQQLQAAGSGGLTAARLAAACDEEEAVIESQLQAMQEAGLLQQQAGVFAANPYRVAAGALGFADRPQEHRSRGIARPQAPQL